MAQLELVKSYVEEKCSVLQPENPDLSYESKSKWLIQSHCQYKF
jgi:hypothetical protein